SPGSYAAVASFAQAPSSQAQEDVFEVGALGRQVVQPNVKFARDRQQPGQRRLDVARAHGELLLDHLGAQHARQLADPRQVEVAVDPGADRGVLVERLDQLEWGIAGDDPAAVHDRDAIAERLRLFHIVGRQDDRLAGGTQVADDVPEI